MMSQLVLIMILRRREYEYSSDIYDVDSYTADEVEDNLEEGSVVVRDGDAIGEWVRYEAEMYWAWVHKRYTTHPKYKKMYSRFSPAIPLE